MRNVIIVVHATDDGIPSEEAGQPPVPHSPDYWRDMVESMEPCKGMKVRRYTVLDAEGDLITQG